MPLHFAIVGPSTGVVILCVVAAQGLYCMWLLVKTQQRAMQCRDSWIHHVPELPAAGAATSAPAAAARPLSGSAPLTFPDLGRLAFGRAGHIAVLFFILSLQLGICSIYISLVAENLQKPMPGGSLIPFAHRWDAILSSYAACALLSLLPDLSGLWPVSGFGTLAMLFALSSAVYAAADELLKQGGGDAPPPSSPPPSPPLVPGEGVLPHRPHFLNLASCAAATFYAFEGMSIVLPIGNALQKSSSHLYGKIVLGAMGFVALLFALVATATATAFPQVDTASITAFLAIYYEGTDSAAYFAACNLVVTAAVVATFPLQLTPAALLIDASFGLRSLRARLLARITTVSCCCGLVLAVRDLSVLIDLVGAVANTAIALLPAAIHARLLLHLPGFRHTTDEDAAGSDAAVCGAGATRTGFHGLTSAAENAVSPLIERASEPPPPLRRSDYLALLVDAVVIVFCVTLMASGVVAEGWCLMSKEHSATRECE